VNRGNSTKVSHHATVQEDPQGRIGVESPFVFARKGELQTFTVLVSADNAARPATLCLRQRSSQDLTPRLQTHISRGRPTIRHEGLLSRVADCRAGAVSGGMHLAHIGAFSQAPRLVGRREFDEGNLACSQPESRLIRPLNPQHGQRAQASRWWTVNDCNDLVPP
jgi:hypothetical protein